MKSTTLSILVAALLIAGCDRPAGKMTPAAPKVDGAKARQMVQGLVALGPRPSGSKAAAAAADYISVHCKAAGYRPQTTEWTEKAGAGKNTFRNIIAELPGRGKEFIIVASHYDTKRVGGAPDYVGANDSGSSTGLLLEIMRVLKAEGGWKGPTIRFVFFDGEEAVDRYSDTDGLHGSRKMAKELRTAGDVKRCRAMILLDMVGDKDLSVTIPSNCDKALIRQLMAVAKRQGQKKHFGHFLRGDGRIIDDHEPFRRLGIRVLNIIDFDYGRNNSLWHSDRDTMEQISPETLAIVGDAVTQLLVDIAAE